MWVMAGSMRYASKALRYSGLLFVVLLAVSLLLNPLSAAAPGPSSGAQASVQAELPVFGHDPAHTGYNPDESMFQPPLIQKWKKSWPLGPVDMSSVLVSGSLVFVSLGGFGQFGAYDA